MSNTGVSFKFLIDGTKLKKNQYGIVVDKVSKGVVNPPAIQNLDFISPAFQKWINPYPQIAFQKIITPQFDGISKYTTMVSNQPDFIKDYHFISLMRCIDYYNQDLYSGYIEIKVDTPKIIT